MDSFASQSKDGSALGASGNLQFDVAIKCWNSDFASKHSSSQIDFSLHDNIVSLAAEDRMRLYVNPQEQVSRWATVDPRLTFAAETNRLAILHTCWHL
jgi:hypothetical protein